MVSYRPAGRTTMIISQENLAQVNRERAMGRDVIEEYRANKQSRRYKAGERIAARRDKAEVREFIWRTGAKSISSLSVIYFIAIGQQAIKIGFTTDIEGRLKQLKQGSPDKVTLVAAIPGGRDLERQLHRRLKEARISGEFFRADAVMEFLGDGVDGVSLTQAETLLPS